MSHNQKHFAHIFPPWKSCLLSNLETLFPLIQFFAQLPLVGRAFFAVVLWPFRFRYQIELFSKRLFWVYLDLPALLVYNFCLLVLFSCEYFPKAPAFLPQHPILLLLHQNLHILLELECINYLH